MFTNIILLPAAILLSFFLNMAIEPVRSVLSEYYDIRSIWPYDPYDLGAWALWGVESFLGALLCFFIARKMGLKTLRFAVCGFVSWAPTFCILAIYSQVKGENKHRHYNSCALFLGGLFLVVNVAGTILLWNKS